MRKQVAREHGLKSGSASADWIVTRRDFLKVSASVAAALSTAPLDARAWSAESAAKVRFGIVTDAHYADTQRRGSRYYRQSVAKMAECVGRMNDEKVDFLIELGDFKDQGAPAVEKDTIEYLRTIEKAFHGFQGPCYHVLGNHDLARMNKKMFLEGVCTDKGYYSFACAPFRGIVLDACFNKDGSPYEKGNFKWTESYVCRKEQEWLERELAARPEPAFVFLHQCLDDDGPHGVRNAAEVRKIMEKSGKVACVFQGHDHKGGLETINGIPYLTLKAMVEGPGEANNSYAVVKVVKGGAIEVEGFGKELSRRIRLGAG